jgi:hypothetical protein
MLPGLYLLFCLLVTRADLASGASWGVKLWGLAPGHGTQGLVGTWAGLFVVICLHDLQNRTWERLWRWIALAMLGICWVSFLMTPWQDQLLHDRSTGLFSDPDQLGVFSALAVLVLIRQRALLWAIGPLVLVGLCQSRGAVLGLGIGAAVMLGWPGLVLGICALIALCWLRVPSAALLDRLALVHQALNAIWAHPWGGWGHGGWFWFSALANDQGLQFAVNDRAHVIWLDWALVAGVPGALVMTGIAGLAAWRLRYERHMLAILIAYTVAMSTLFET